MWQDYALTLCAVLFGYSLIPQMIKIHKKKTASQFSWQLLFCQFCAITIASFTVLSLDLFLAAIINFTQLILLIVIIGQKIHYERML